MVPFRLEASSLIHGDFSICTAMSGSGSRIAGRQIHSRFRPTVPRSRAPGIATSASFAGAVLLRRPGAYGPQFELPSVRPRRLTVTVSASLFRSAIDLCRNDFASERLAKPVASQGVTPASVIHRCTTGRERRITRWQYETRARSRAAASRYEPAVDAHAPRDS